jgi:Protein of unknown function (DUF1553)/Protein of unknown function (DUF1549)/Planctomycete cytochrome C
MTRTALSSLMPLILLIPTIVRGNDHFETNVRPLLAEHCYRCHGPAKQNGSLRVDSPEALAKPGDGGTPLVVPGKPGESRLLKAVQHAEGVAAMPEGKPKLSAKAIADLTKWIADGAKWPGPASSGDSPGKPHWAFLTVARPYVPAVKNGDWPIGEIDRFVLAKLEAKKLTPSPAADKRTWLRRVSFDLTGLPPTMDELTAFEKDDSAEAYSRVVDRLLASPHFGERWGRHWLDVARYAETSGAPVVEEDVRYPFAYSYRDWVVSAFNGDLPYDQFVRRQIAADKLTSREGDPELAALGFLTLGRKFENSAPDIIDDRLDVIFRGLQGLSIGCARCHDHKFDPIPIRDYYSLSAVFQNATESHVPLIAGPATRASYLAFAAELRARIRSFEKFKREQRLLLAAPGWQEPGRYLTAAHSKEEVQVGDRRRRADGLDQQVVDRVRDLLSGLDRYHHPVMAPWHVFSKLPPEKFAAEAKPLAAKIAANADGDKPVNPLVAALFAGTPPRDLGDVATRYGRLFGTVARKWLRKVAEADRVDIARPELLEDEAEDEIRKMFFGEFPNFELSEEDLMNRLDDAPRKTFDTLRNSIGDWNTGPEAPPHARLLVDPAEPATPHVLVRGREENRGEEVPRQFLAVLSGKSRKPFAEGTGRRELAEAIASKENPLTARVWVNRIWGHLFGRAIVATTSDFGTRSTPPTHPELLDWLASSLMDDGWSTKKLIRRIVLSAAYRQSSAEPKGPAAKLADPENTLLWRMNRKRLEIEPFRDAMRVAAGTLDRTLGGRPENHALTADAASGRRTLYLPVDRGDLSPMFRTFDFANPDLSSPGRHESTVPQQSLFLLNHPFVIAQARRLAAIVAATDDTAWVRGLYAAALTRTPTDPELTRAKQFLAAAGALKETGPKPPVSPWQYGYATWTGDSKTLGKFTLFGTFRDDEWRPAAEYPDKTFGYLTLSDDGGIPGETAGQCAVRRWIAPVDGRATIRGTLRHKRGDDVKPEQTDGLKGYVVASRGGLKVAVDVNHSEAATDATFDVKAGETIDFVADPKSGNSYDGFIWTVSITLKPLQSPGREIGYDSKDDFRGPPPATARPLSPREKFAQVLLMSAEFAFVD